MLLAFFVLILAILIGITAYAAIIGAPLAITGKNHLDQIMTLADLKDGDVFYELGSGTGRVVAAASRQAKVRAVGFELSPFFYWLGWLNLKIRGCRNWELRWQDFFKADLSEADVVFCYLMPKTLKRMKEKFEKELKPGAKVITYAFRLHYWPIVKTVKNPNQLPFYLYIKN